MVVPLAGQYNSSTISIPLDFEFTERIYIYYFFGVGDIIAKIGGINGFFSPILGKLAPFFVMFFLYSLAKILREKSELAYQSELKQFLEYSKEEINKHALDKLSKKDLEQRIDTLLSDL